MDIIFYNTTFKAPMSFYFSGWIIFSGCPDGLRINQVVRLWINRSKGA